MGCAVSPSALVNGMVDVAVNSFAFSLNSPLIVPGLQVRGDSQRVVSGPYHRMGSKHTRFYEAFARHQLYNKPPTTFRNNDSLLKIESPWFDVATGLSKRFRVIPCEQTKVKEKTTLEVSLPYRGLEIYQAAGRLKDCHSPHRTSDYGFTAIGINLHSGDFLREVAKHDDQDMGPCNHRVINSLEDGNLTPLTALHLALCLEGNLNRISGAVAMDMRCEAVEMPSGETIGRLSPIRYGMHAMQEVQDLFNLIKGNEYTRLSFYKDVPNSRGKPYRALDVHFDISIDDRGHLSRTISILQRGFYHNSNGLSKPFAQGIVDLVLAAARMHRDTFPIQNNR